MFERLLQVGRDVRERTDLRGLIEDCRQLLTARGESNSLVIAARALERYQRLSTQTVPRFFEVLAAGFDPDPDEVLRRAERYATTRSPDALIQLWRAAESPRQELLRRLNRAPDGTATLVAMRAKLLESLAADPSLKALDADFQHLLSSWFNPGFLNLVQVDWSSPASLLEKLIQHEAVHEIDGWDDLRRRLEPDRRCFAFFHPALPGEPLIFVEVALLEDMPDAIAPLLDRRSQPETRDARFKVAAFYSISNCQPGLRGVNLGDFLIKRVAERLQLELPKLRMFCTLSPIPSFASWLAKVDEIDSPRLKPGTLAELTEALRGLRERHGRDLARLVIRHARSAEARFDGVADEQAGVVSKSVALAADAHAGGAHDVGEGHAERRELAERREPAERQAQAEGDAADVRTLQRLCAAYLLGTSPGDQRPSDPVARFHLNNGARLERIHAGADLSRKGLRQSYAMMVNYLYDLDQIEANHEKFLGDRVSASRTVLSLP